MTGRRVALVAALAAALALSLAGSAGAAGAADGDEPTVSVDHPETVGADGEFTLSVEAERSAATVVEVEPPGGDVTAESDDAVAAGDGRVRFLDPEAGNSTYEVTVDLEGASPGETGEVVAWVDADHRHAAADVATTSFDVVEGHGGRVVAIDHPDAVSAGGDLSVTVETAAAAGTVVEVAGDGVDLTPSSDEAVRADGSRLEFLDAGGDGAEYEVDVDVTGGSDGGAGEIRAWVNDDGMAGADDAATSSFDVTTDGTAAAEVVALEHPEAVDADGEFELVVETADSAGTVVEVEGDGVDVSPSSDDALRVADGRAEFADLSAGDSTYAVAVNVSGGSDGDVVDVAAWVNADSRSDADDVATGAVSVTADGTTPALAVDVARVEDAVATEPVNVTATVSNDGSAPASGEVDLRVDDRGAVDTASVSLDGGESTNVTLQWTPAADDDGEHDLVVATASDDATRTVTVDEAGDDDDDGGDSGGGLPPGGGGGGPGGGDDDDDGEPDDGEDGDGDEGDEGDEGDDDSQDGDDGDEGDDGSGEAGDDDPGEAPDDGDDESDGGEDGGGDGDDGTPGFGVLAAFGALAAVLLGARRAADDG